MRWPVMLLRWPAMLAALFALGAVASGVGAAHADTFPSTARPGSRGDDPGERFVGAGACGACHEAALRAWRAGPHARSARHRLGDDARRRRCQSCHTTGDAPAGRSVFDDVQCEACHGAGVGYAPDDVMRNPTLARALGLRDLSTDAARDAMCARCHRPELRTRLTPFDAATAWRRIGHGRGGATETP